MTTTHRSHSSSSPSSQSAAQDAGATATRENHDPAFGLPPLGNNPSSANEGTTPGSFANPPDIGGVLTFSSPDTPGMPQPSDKTAWDFMPPDWRRLPEGERLAAPARDDRAPANAYAFAPPEGFEPITQLESARLGLVTPAMRRVAERESHLSPEEVRDEVAAGRMVIPANRVHLENGLDPMAIGRASKTKVNANMGASPVSSGTHEEVEKLHWAVRWEADTVMDLSTGGNVTETRGAICQASTVPIGTVPLYSMILDRKIEELDAMTVLDCLEAQAEQGVDYFTIHAGVRREHLPFVSKRLIGIVSRGGSLLAKWMIHHEQENLMSQIWDDICELVRRYDVTFSIGDGLRPGGLADATDVAQLGELQALGELTERAWRHGCQVMIEGPGHVPFDQIEFNMKLQRRLCHGAPFYVLGPLVTDIFPGYDHITSSIGATAAAYHGASMLCYVTPKEHLGLPKKDDVKQGCVAYKIAAHAADVALGIPGARNRDDELTKARAALNWEKHFELSFDPDLARAFHDEDLDVDTDFCAMCGHDWCSVRISKEISLFVSGKDESYQWDKPKISQALNPAQREILAQRGVLSAEEIHRLASKTRESMGLDGRKAACHSDLVDDDSAHHLQTERLDPVTLEPEQALPPSPGGGAGS